MRIAFAIALLLAPAATLAESAGTVRVSVVDLRNDAGVVRVALFDRAEGFPSEGRAAFRHLSVPVVDGRAEAVFDAVPYGAYGIGFVHDEDADGEMDFGALGVPLEGYGASNDARGMFGPPTWAAALFQVAAPTTRQVLHTVYLR